MEKSYKDLAEKYPYLQGLLIDCGTGWYDLLEAAMKVLDAEKAKGYHPRVVQVKEKYGILRIYAQDISNDGHKQIMQIETMSSRICEFTGEPGRLHVLSPSEDNLVGWFKTVSETYAESYVDDAGRKFRLPHAEPVMADIKSFYHNLEVNS